MKLRLTEDAASDLEGIKQFSEDIDAGLGGRVLGQIGGVLRLLKEWPEVGHSGKRGGTLEMVVPRLPLVVVYRTDITDGAEELIVLRVYHTRQNRW